MRQSVPLSAIACLILLFAASPQGVFADVLISNLSGPNLSSTLFGPNSTTVFKAAGWTMPGNDYSLDSVTLDLTFLSTGVAQVEIWSGAAIPTTPEIILDSPPQTGSGEFTFTPSAPFMMLADQTYWVYVTALPGSDDFNWISSSMAPAGIATNVGYIWNGNPSSFMNKYEVAGTLAGGCVGDLDGDGDTDLADLGILLADFGCMPPPGPCVGDLNGDGITDLADLGILLADFGCTP